MKIAISPAAVFLILISTSARCDTVTTKDNLSRNGTLVGMSDGVITLNARFSSGPKTLQIPIDSVQNIEFNLVTYNPVAPPKTLGIAPGQNKPAAPQEVIPGDVIVLRGNDRRACKLVSIDANRVYCNPKDPKSEASSFVRNVVLRIQVGAQ